MRKGAPKAARSSEELARVQRVGTADPVYLARMRRVLEHAR